MCRRVEEAVRRGHAELGPDEWLEYHRVRGILVLVTGRGYKYVEVNVSDLLERCRGRGGG